MKNIEGIIFDLDGTLLDTSYDCATAVNLTLEYFGYPTHPVKTIASFLNNGASKLIERALPENCRDKENVSKVLEKYLPLYAEHIYEKTVPYDGIMSFLKKAKEKNFEDWMKAFCNRKYNSDFSVEMSASVREYLKQWKD